MITYLLHKITSLPFFYSPEKKLDQNLKAALTRHSPAREKQVDSAIRDTSPFINLGTSLGVLTNQLDGYAPDEGLPSGQTFWNDLDTHLIFGLTGSGMTSGTLRPIIKPRDGRPSCRRGVTPFYRVRLRSLLRQRRERARPGTRAR